MQKSIVDRLDKPLAVCDEMRCFMKFDLSGINQSFVNNAAVLEDLNRQREDTLRAVAQANQERIEREEKMVAGAEASIAQKELLEQEVEIIQKQNMLLSDNYSKLKEMFDSQVEANKEAKEELRRSRRFNVAMMIIAIIAMLAAIAGPIATVLVSK